MPIIVEREYSRESKAFSLLDFHEKRHQFVTRPPYQRKNVWSKRKKKALIESFFRRYYVPDIVLREVHTPDNQMRYEVIDGQQRIIAIQEFFSNEICLPQSLKDLVPEEAGKLYKDLSSEVREYIEDRTLNATIIRGLTSPEKEEDQRHTTEIFWRLNQGERLSYIEKEHSKLYSAARGFVTKYADDLSFDYQEYKSRSRNPERHRFFKIINMKNDRLQHLALLTRFLILEFDGGPANLNRSKLGKFIDEWEGKSLEEFEEKEEVKKCKETLDVLYEIFKDDPSVKEGRGKVPELDREYVVISVYLLVSKLIHRNWSFGRDYYGKFREFIHNFYQRFQEPGDEDSEMVLFRDYRRQSKEDVAIRDQLITKWFLEENPDLDELDPQRNFSYRERVRIYRKDNGICQKCLEEGLSEQEATVSWSKFDADHLRPHSEGGKTSVANGQVLCEKHNRSLGTKDE